MAILYTKPRDWETYRRTLPQGFRAIKDSEAVKDPAILKAAREFINRQVKGKAPIGTSEPHVINGKSILFIVEPHYHEPKGPVKPWGWHKGATTFIGPAPAPVPTAVPVRNEDWGGMAALRMLEGDSIINGEHHIKG